MAQRCAVPTRPGHPLWSGPRGATNTAGASLLTAPRFLAERAMGAKKRRHKGSARAGELRKVFAKQNPEGGQAKPGRAFGAYLARRTAGAMLLPLRALPYRSKRGIDSP